MTMKRQEKDRPVAATMQAGTEAPSMVTTLTEYWPVRLIVYLGALMLVVILTKLLSMPFVPAPSSPTYEPLVTARNILQAAAMIAVYSFLVRKLEHRQVHETALRSAAPALLSGLIIGSGLIAAAYLVLYALGVADFRPGTGLTGLTTAILKPAVIGTLEELVFRVILFRVLQNMVGTLAAVVVSASLFGFAHLGNPGATPIAVAFLTVEMGVFFALVYAFTQNLWVVAASHMSWNFTLGFIFGSDVSGLESTSGLILTTFKGPALLTGGSFGPEGSVITLGVSLIAILVTVWLIARGHLWQPAKFELRENRLSAAV